LVLALRLAAANAAAQPVRTRDGADITVHATRITAPIRIDGRLDEAVYQQGSGGSRGSGGAGPPYTISRTLIEYRNASGSRLSSRPLAVSPCGYMK
jgi:hypothetical protein